MILARSVSMETDVCDRHLDVTAMAMLIVGKRQVAVWGGGGAGGGGVVRIEKERGGEGMVEVKISCSYPGHTLVYMYV